MPTYTYKAVTRTGLIVRNRVESASRQGLIKMLKDIRYWKCNIRIFFLTKDNKYKIK